MNPRDVPLIFIPWRTLLWALPVTVAIALFAFSRPGLGLTFLVFVAALGLVSGWCHYLIHSGYKPKSRLFRSVWMNHRQHHYRNEHYWFTVTTSEPRPGARHCPDPASVAASRTAKNLTRSRMHDDGIADAHGAVVPGCVVGLRLIAMAAFALPCDATDHGALCT